MLCRRVQAQQRPFEEERDALLEVELAFGLAARIAVHDPQRAVASRGCGATRRARRGSASPRSIALFEPLRPRARQAAGEQFVLRDRGDEAARLVQFVDPGFVADASGRQHAGQAQPVRRRVRQALVGARDRLVEQALGDLVDRLDARLERFAVAQSALVDGVEAQIECVLQQLLGRILEVGDDLACRSIVPAPAHRAPALRCVDRDEWPGTAAQRIAAHRGEIAH